MKKPQYTYYTLQNQDTFVSGENRYLMRRDSSGDWVDVSTLRKESILSAGKCRDFDKFVKDGPWKKADSKLSRRAAQLNKK